MAVDDGEAAEEVEVEGDPGVELEDIKVAEDIGEPAAIEDALA